MIQTRMSMKARQRRGLGGLMVAGLVVVGGSALAQTDDTLAFGAPVVTPPAAMAQTPMATSDWRLVPAEDLMVIDTTKGRILVELLPEIAPLHVERMRLLARNGFYDTISWHRVIDTFMAQTGDPLGNGEGQSPYPDLKGEFTFRRGPEMGFAAVAAPVAAQLGFIRSLPVQTQPDAVMATTADGKVHGWGIYCPGVAGMARDEGNDTANSQFFLMRQAYPSLDKRYSIWGMVVSGVDVVRQLKVGDGDNGMVTSDPDRMIRVRIASDIPVVERPVVSVMDPTSAAFATRIADIRAARGADFSICDVVLPTQIQEPASAMAAPGSS